MNLDRGQLIPLTLYLHTMNIVPFNPGLLHFRLVMFWFKKCSNVSSHFERLRWVALKQMFKFFKFLPKNFLQNIRNMKNCSKTHFFKKKTQDFHHMTNLRLFSIVFIYNSKPINLYFLKRSIGSS
jgi:hypothetical protein